MTTTGISGVENRISEARERHQELHRSARKNSADWRELAASYAITVKALNEAREVIDAKANAALALSVLAATVSLITVAKRR